MLLKSINFRKPRTNTHLYLIENFIREHKLPSIVKEGSRLRPSEKGAQSLRRRRPRVISSLKNTLPLHYYLIEVTMVNRPSTWLTPQIKSKFIRVNYLLITSPPGQPLDQCSVDVIDTVLRYKEAAIQWIEGNEQTPETDRWHTHILLIFPHAVDIDVNELPEWNYTPVSPESLHTVANYVKKNGNYVCKEESISQ